jgi:antitoxin HigA-1
MGWRVPFMCQRAASTKSFWAKRDITADTDLRLARYFGLSEGFFLGLQMDYDLMQRRREIDRDLKAIRPRAA